MYLSVDRNVDWLAYATERKKAFERRTQLAAQALAEKRALPPPPPPAPVRERPKPVKKAAPFDKLAAHRHPWRVIVGEVCKKHKLNPKDLFGERRFKTFSSARHEAFWRMRYELKMSLLDIAYKMGKDHSTVLHGIRKYASEHPTLMEKYSAAS